MCLLGGFIVIDVKKWKCEMVGVFVDVRFEFYKWYLNGLDLEKIFGDDKFIFVK